MNHPDCTIRTSHLSDPRPFGNQTHKLKKNIFFCSDALYNVNLKIQTVPSARSEASIPQIRQRNPYSREGGLFGDIAIPINEVFFLWWMSQSSKPLHIGRPMT
jgi:hypothetical protein